MKETENLIFSGVRFFFNSLMNTKSGNSCKYSFLCSFDEIKIDLTPKNQISSIYLWKILLRIYLNLQMHTLMVLAMHIIPTVVHKKCL